MNPKRLKIVKIVEDEAYLVLSLESCLSFESLSSRYDAREPSFVGEIRYAKRVYGQDNPEVPREGFSIGDDFFLSRSRGESSAEEPLLSGS